MENIMDENILKVGKYNTKFNDILGYDDFPTEIKFTVDLEHCMPRDNAMIENMFNGAKGRFYSFTNGEVLSAYNSIDSMQNFQKNDNMTNQEKNMAFDVEGSYTKLQSQHKVMDNDRLKIIGGHLNG